MAYRSYGGFAEGFKGGFGLMSDVMDRRARKEIADEENRLRGVQLANEKTYRDGLLRAQEETNKIAADKLAWDKDPNNPAYISNKKQGEYYGAQTEGRNLDNTIKQDEFDEKTTKRTNKQKQILAAASAEKFLRLANQVRSGERTLTDDVITQLGEYKLAASDSLLDLDQAIDPDTQYQKMQFRQVLEAFASGNMEGVNNETVRGVLNVVLRSNNLQGKGEEVTSETHPYAGTYADRGFVIKNKAVSSIAMLKNGSLLGKVDVTVVSPETGEEFVYEAPMTFGRQGGTDPVDMNFEQLVDAAGGYFEYANAIAPYTEMLNTVNSRLYDSRNGEGAFEQKVNSLVSEYKINNTDLQAESPIKGMSVGDFVTDIPAMNRYFSAAVLNPDKLEEKPESIGDRNYALMAGSAPVKEIERLLGKPMTRAQVLQSAPYLDLDEETGRITVSPQNRDGWTNFKNKILGRKKRTNPNPRGINFTDPD